MENPLGINMLKMRIRIFLDNNMNFKYMSEKKKVIIKAQKGRQLKKKYRL